MIVDRASLEACDNFLKLIVIELYESSQFWEGVLQSHDKEKVGELLKWLGPLIRDKIVKEGYDTVDMIAALKTITCLLIESLVRTAVTTLVEHQKNELRKMNGSMYM